MVKKFFLILFSLCLLACFYNRTDYGHIRFKPSRFSIIPNTNPDVYRIIDTTKLYELVDIINTKQNQRPNSLKREFLKFYANGRVGEFEFYNKLDIKSLDPKKAKMAYYNYDGKSLVIQIYLEHPQGGGLIKLNYNEINGDTLKLIVDKYIYKYKILDLQNEFLVYKPDW